MTNINALFSSYPRIRPPLTAAHEAVYVEQYRLNREGGTPIDAASQKLERWMHWRVARNRGEPVLELGAGTLNHLQFEDANLYDVVEPFHELYTGRPVAARVRHFYDSVAHVPSENRYARIISVAVLEHLTNLPHDIAQCALRLREGGSFQAGIPSEGGFLWWLGWRGATGLGYYLRTGLDYGVVMRHEHVNTAPEILVVLNHFFARVVVQRFPTPLHQLSFYTYVEASHPKREVAAAFVQQHVAS